MSRPTFDVTGSSAEIDARVRAKLRPARRCTRSTTRCWRRCAPDVIITQTHCEVCAVSAAADDRRHSPPPPRAARRARASRRPTSAPAAQRRPVVALAAGTVDGILDGFLSVAEVLGAPDAGRALVGWIRARLDALAAETSLLPAAAVACLEWVEPLFAMGNWGARADHARRRRTRRSGPRAPTRPPSPGRRCRRPIPTSSSWRLADSASRHAGGDAGADGAGGWNEARAVREGRVFVADGNLDFNRSGPLLFETPEDPRRSILDLARLPPRPTRGRPAAVSSGSGR